MPEADSVTEPVVTELPLPGVPTTPPVAASPPAPAKPGKKTGMMEIPEREFMNRVQRQAASLIKAKLGVTLEEAETIVKNAAASTPGDADAKETADQAVAKERAKSARLEKQLEEANRLAAVEKKRAAKDRERAANKLMEREVAHAAAIAGFRDPDYAMTLYARALKAALAEDKTLEASEYFSTIKGDEKYSYLFAKTGAAETPVPKPAPVVVAPTTAPPESKAPGEATPAPKPAGGLPASKSADDMNTQEFASHARGKYNWSPSS